MVGIRLLQEPAADGVPAVACRFPRHPAIIAAAPNGWRDFSTGRPDAADAADQRRRANRPASPRTRPRSLDTVGWSPLGLVVSLAVLAPNLLLLAFPPRGQAPHPVIPTWLAWLERAGQALCVVVPAITAPGALHAPWPTVGAVATAIAVAASWALSLRYLAAGRPWSALYRPAWRVPVPMAVAPVLAFLAASVWLGDGWIALSAVVLAAGHIPVAVLTARAVTEVRASAH